MKFKNIASVFGVMLVTGSAFAMDSNEGKNVKGCPVTFEQLRAALDAAKQQKNGQFDLDMWASVVTKEGRVCAVAKTGANLNDQWLASRVISAQKAYTSASLSNNQGSFGTASNKTVGFTTAGLYTASVPGGPLYGLQHSNPVDTSWAYAGESHKFGTANDPMIGRYVGGINVFGGGLPLFDANGQVIGGIGVSGNTSCADHNIAWRIRGSFAAQGIAQGAVAEFGIDYAGGYPGCGAPNATSDDVWSEIGTGGSNPISQFLAP